MNIPGRPTALSAEEEEEISRYCIMSSTYGFPLTLDDVRYIVKSYIDRIGKAVPQFKNNLPGKKWVKSFLKRQPALTERVAKNITIARAGVNEGNLNKFFDHYEKEIEGVPACNIYNYDETNLSDDPGIFCS